MYSVMGFCVVIPACYQIRLSISSTPSYGALVPHRLAGAVHSTIVQPVLKSPDRGLPTPTSLVFRSVTMRSSSNMSCERQIIGQTYVTNSAENRGLFPFGVNGDTHFCHPLIRSWVKFTKPIIHVLIRPCPLRWCGAVPPPGDISDAVGGTRQRRRGGRKKGTLNSHDAAAYGPVAVACYGPAPAASRQVPGQSHGTFKLQLVHRVDQAWIHWPEYPRDF